MLISVKNTIYGSAYNTIYERPKTMPSTNLVGCIKLAPDYKDLLEKVPIVNRMPNVWGWRVLKKSQQILHHPRPSPMVLADALLHISATVSTHSINLTYILPIRKRFLWSGLLRISRWDSGFGISRWIQGTNAMVMALLRRDSSIFSTSHACRGWPMRPYTLVWANYGPEP